MKQVLFVGMGGFAGAIARYGVNLIVARFWFGEFPLATLLINVSGSFVLGFFSTYATSSSALDPAWRLFLATGFIGAYTTFSTFQYETHRLVATGGTSWAILNVLLSLVAGFAAVRMGVWLAE